MLLWVILVICYRQDAISSGKSKLQRRPQVHKNDRNFKAMNKKLSNDLAAQASINMMRNYSPPVDRKLVLDIMKSSNHRARNNPQNKKKSAKSPRHFLSKPDKTGSIKQKPTQTNKLSKYQSKSHSISV